MVTYQLGLFLKFHQDLEQKASFHICELLIVHLFTRIFGVYDLLDQRTVILL